jgi:hypothetical protein
MMMMMMMMMICCMSLASDSQDPYLSLVKTRPWGVVRAQTAPQTARIVRSSYIKSHRRAQRERERERDREKTQPCRGGGMWMVMMKDVYALFTKDSQPRTASNTGTYACIKQLPNVFHINPWRAARTHTLIAIAIDLKSVTSHHIRSLPSPPLRSHHTTSHL